jgi:hypothetical protein
MNERLEAVALLAAVFPIFAATVQAMLRLDSLTTFLLLGFSLLAIAGVERLPRIAVMLAVLPGLGTVIAAYSAASALPVLDLIAGYILALPILFLTVGLAERQPGSALFLYAIAYLGALANLSATLGGATQPLQLLEAVAGQLLIHDITFVSIIAGRPTSLPAADLAVTTQMAVATAVGALGLAAYLATRTARAEGLPPSTSLSAWATTLVGAAALTTGVVALSTITQGFQVLLVQAPVFGFVLILWWWLRRG